MNKITVFCEFNKEKNALSSCSYELITKAYELSKQAQELNNTEFFIEAICCDNVENIENKEKIFSSGANKFVLIENKNIENHNFDVLKDTFLNYYKDNKSDVILFPATAPMRHCAPCITVNLDCGLVADCIDLNFILKDENLMLSATRPTFGSELMATIISKKLPQCATIRPGIFKNKTVKDENGEFIKIQSEIENNKKIKLISNILQNNNDEINIESAEIILCAGYGLNSANREYFKKLEKIAQITKTQIGCTRKVVDFGIMDSKYQIGLTGSNTKAQLYIGFGVAGAIQHMCSVKNSKKIVAINTDADAEIFNYCDYKIVGDAKKIIDEILTQIEQ